jgi:hypothetical protein
MYLRVWQFIAGQFAADMSREQSCLIFSGRKVREESASRYDDIREHGYHFRFIVKFGLVPN